MSCRALLGAAIWGVLVFPTNFPPALAQDAPAADRLLAGNAEDSPPMFSETTADSSPDAGDGGAGWGQSSIPRWTASADCIMLERVGSVNQSLVERVPSSVKFHELKHTAGVEALNADDFRQGFAAGPQVGLTGHGNDGYDLELSFFQIDGWSSSRTIGPDNPVDWLVMRAPGGFLQAQDHPYQAMAWEYDTKLYNAELNVHWDPGSWVTLLAGFRWVNLHENLQGALVPSTWEPPFWNNTTTNNLYGFQIGADGKLLDRGRFSLDALVKAGMYDDNAEESTGVSIFKVPRPSATSTNHGAFVGETGLQCKYQLTQRLVAKLGYEALWLEGIALAPGQIQETRLTPPKTEHAVGVNCDSGVFFHGATAGLEFSF